MARKMFSVLMFIVSAVVLFTTKTNAQTNNIPPVVDGSVVYQIDMSRIKNPVNIRIAVGTFDSTNSPGAPAPSEYYTNRYIKGLTMWDVFRKTLTDADKYCIVRIKIWYDGSGTNFEFLYAEWSQVLPDPKAPKLKPEKDQ
jgi:hypothetical protein